MFPLGVGQNSFTEAGITPGGRCYTDYDNGQGFCKRVGRKGDGHAGPHGVCIDQGGGRTGRCQSGSAEETPNKCNRDSDCSIGHLCRDSDHCERCTCKCQHPSEGTIDLNGWTCEGACGVEDLHKYCNGGPNVEDQYCINALGWPYTPEPWNDPTICSSSAVKAPGEPCDNGDQCEKVGRNPKHGVCRDGHCQSGTEDNASCGNNGDTMMGEKVDCNVGYNCNDGKCKKCDGRSVSWTCPNDYCGC